MIVEKFNIFKNEENKQKYLLILNRPTKGDKLILMNLPYESSDVISSIDINKFNSNTIYNINNTACFFTTKQAERRLDYILDKYPDYDWNNKDNWSIITRDDLDLLISTNKFNI